MNESLTSAADAVLARVVSGSPRVPGVVAMVTDRDGAIYEGAAGKRSLPDGPDMTLDTVFFCFSTTKAITGTAALQLVEAGKLDLDAPAENYVPELGNIRVLDGFDADGKPKLRAPKRDITTRHLLLHTAGFAYEFFNATYLRLVTEHGQLSIMSGSKGSLSTPLLFDPGDAWEYGTSIDWVGQVVEAIAGKRLGEVFAEKIFAPLGITSSGFAVTSDMRSRLAALHARAADGSLTAIPESEAPPDALHFGGGNLYTTVGDYLKFIRMWLNDGAGDHGRVLKAETVEMAAQNHLGDMKIKVIRGVIPGLSNDFDIFPGMPKSWALTFMINDEPAPTGRPAGSLAWAGLGNLYYWIDRKSGIGGFWATHIFPFADATSLGGYLDFETAVYANMPQLAHA